MVTLVSPVQYAIIHKMPNTLFIIRTQKTGKEFNSFPVFCGYIALLWEGKILRLEVEELVGVVVADVFDHLVDTLLLISGVRDEAVLDVVSYEVAEGTTEVLVTRVGEERTAVGKHLPQGACIPHLCQYLSPDIFGYCTAFLKFRWLHSEFQTPFIDGLNLHLVTILLYFAALMVSE